LYIAPPPTKGEEIDTGNFLPKSRSFIQVAIVQTFIRLASSLFQRNFLLVVGEKVIFHEKDKVYTHLEGGISHIVNTGGKAHGNLSVQDLKISSQQWIKSRFESTQQISRKQFQ
jgi:hypothetical protein